MAVVWSQPMDQRLVLVYSNLVKSKISSKVIRAKWEELFETSSQPTAKAVTEHVSKLRKMYLTASSDQSTSTPTKKARNQKADSSTSKRKRAFDDDRDDSEPVRGKIEIGDDEMKSGDRLLSPRKRLPRKAKERPSRNEFASGSESYGEEAIQDDSRSEDAHDSDLSIVKQEGGDEIVVSSPVDHFQGFQPRTPDSPLAHMLENVARTSSRLFAEWSNDLPSNSKEAPCVADALCHVHGKGKGPAAPIRFNKKRG